MWGLSSVDRSFVFLEHGLKQDFCMLNWWKLCSQERAFGFDTPLSRSVGSDVHFTQPPSKTLNPSHLSWWESAFSNSWHLWFWCWLLSLYSFSHACNDCSPHQHLPTRDHTCSETLVIHSWIFCKFLCQQVICCNFTDYPQLWMQLEVVKVLIPPWLQSVNLLHISVNGRMRYKAAFLKQIMWFGTMVH